MEVVNKELSYKLIGAIDAVRGGGGIVSNKAGASIGGSIDGLARGVDNAGLPSGVLRELGDSKSRA